MIALPFFSTAPEMPRVRAAHSGDARAFADIHARAFHRGWDAEEFERLLAERTGVAHALCGGPRLAPVGFVLSHLVAPEAEILSIALSPQVRGRGLARPLLEYHLRALAAAGATCSLLEVEDGNAPALRLYARLGYVEIGRRKGYYAGSGAPADAVVMRRDF